MYKMQAPKVIITLVTMGKVFKLVYKNTESKQVFTCESILTKNDITSEYECWFIAYDVITFLKYKNPLKVLKKEIHPTLQRTYGELKSKIISCAYWTEIDSKKWTDDIILINVTALELLSYIPEKNKGNENFKFRQWVRETMIPTLMETFNCDKAFPLSFPPPSAPSLPSTPPLTKRIVNPGVTKPLPKKTSLPPYNYVRPFSKAPKLYLNGGVRDIEDNDKNLMKLFVNVFIDGNTKTT